MVSTLVDIVKITAASNGTGAITLGPAVPGYRGVEALTDGLTYSYSIKSDSNWEVGRAVYLAAQTRLIRSPIFSSNGGTAVDFPAGTSISFVVLGEDIQALAQLSAKADQINDHLTQYQPVLDNAIVAAQAAQVSADGASGARTAAQAAATLADHYANDNTDTDVPGGSPGERGARFWANKFSTALPPINQELSDHDNRINANAQAISAEATRASAAEATLMPKSGGTFTGAVNMSGQALTGLPSPSSDTDAINRNALNAALSGPISELANHEARIASNTGDIAQHNQALIAHAAELDVHAQEIAANTTELSAHDTSINKLFATAYGSATNITVRGNLPYYDPTQFNGQGSGAVQASADPVFAAYGCGFEVTNFGPAQNSANFVVTLPRPLRPKSWAAVSVLVRSTDGISWPLTNFTAFRALFFDILGNQTSALFGPASYEQIDATHRRYYLATQNTGSTDYVAVWICVYGQGCAFSGFAAGIADRQIADVDWEAFDPLAVVYPAGDNIAIGGNLPIIDQTKFGGLGSGALQVSADPLFTTRGCVNEVAGFTAAGNTANFIVTPVRRVRPGGWVAASVLVRSPDGAAWPAANSAMMRIICFNTNNGQDLFALGNNYEQLDATHRRYKVAVQNTSIFDWNKFWLCVYGQGMAFTGFAAAINDRRIVDVQWEDWDPFNTAAQDAKAASLDARLVPLEAAVVAPQVNPDLLIQSSYSLIQGQPLCLLRDGLTSYRELIQYDIAALNTNGVNVGGKYASPVLELDGATYFGDGYFAAKPKNRDVQQWYKAKTYFYRSAPTKTGAVRFHLLGDSLTGRGIAKEVSGRLAAAGLTVTMVGTVVDNSNDLVGGLCEGRPNWKAANYTFASLNTDFGLPFYDVFPLRPNGGSGMAIGTAITNGSVTAASVAGGTGYPPGIWYVIFDPPTSDGQSGTRARGTVTINSSGVPTGIAVTAGGSGYTSAPSGQVVASYAEYLALPVQSGYGVRWHYNPYVRPATAAEITANDSRIQNGYVFDFQSYVTNLLAGMAPDQVAVILGMNDLLKGGTPISAFLAIGQIVTAIRAGAPNAPVAIGIVGQASTAVWANFVTLTKLLMGPYKGQEANKLFILPLFQVIDDKFTYDSEHDTSIVTATDPQTGMQTIVIADPTHFNDVGRAQAAEMIFAWSMCRLP